MEIARLKAFVTVAREKNLTRSSELLHITQPALSAQIKTLEEELGILLFHRASRGMELTECGSGLLKDAVHILEALQSFKDRVEILKKVPSGKIFLGINASIKVLKVDELNSMLSADFPQIQIHLLQSTSSEIKEHIARREVDFGFIFGHCSDPSMASIKLGQMSLRLVAHSQWERQARNGDLKKLEDQTWIMRSERCPFYAVLKKFLQEHNLNPKRMIFSNQDQVVYDLIQNERGVSFLLESDAVKLQRERQIALVPHEPLKIDLLFAYNEGRIRNPAHQAILESVKKIWNNTPQADNEMM